MTKFGDSQYLEIHNNGPDSVAELSILWLNPGQFFPIQLVLRKLVREAI
jgi:hypothetical protein